MKLSFILIVVASLNVFANAFSQNISLSNDIGNTPIKEVLKTLEAQSNYRFFYSDDFNVLDKKVTLKAQNADIRSILEQIFQNTPASVEFMEGGIVIITPFAQPGITITGTVTDDSGPLPGVNVSVKGTTTGVVTDVDGRYRIVVPNRDAVLVYSFVGYASSELQVGDQREMNIAMEVDMREIQEVVVVGYGTQKKVNLTGSVAAVKVDETITNRSLTNVSSGLQGLLPGLYVSQNSGMAGANSVTLMIRGMGTVNNSNPLIVVDGLPDVDINRLNMNDIENISVLKDAASASIYGSRGANGVILITTKTGKGSEKTTVNLSASHSWDYPVNAQRIMDDYARTMESYNRRQMLISAPENWTFKQGTIDQWMALSMIDPLRYPNTDWWDEIIRTGSIQKYDVSATGSSEKANFYGSIGLQDQKGMQINNDYTMYTARFNFDYKVMRNLNVGMRFSGNWSKYTYFLEEGFAKTGAGYLATATPGMTPYDPVTGYYGGAMAYGENATAYNLLYYFTEALNRRNRQEVLPSVYIDWAPVKGLTARLNYSINYYNQFRYLASTPATAYNFQTGQFTSFVITPANAPVQNFTETGYKTQLDGLLTYHLNIASNHDINVTAGYSEEYWYDRSQDASRNDRLHPSLHEIDGALTTTQSNAGTSSAEGLRSFFGRINYAAFDKYLLEVNLRADGSSLFYEGHQWGYFPSASVGWRFSEENFIKSFAGGWLNQGKLRVSYGSTGNNKLVSTSRYVQRETLDAANYWINGAAAKGFVNNKMINQNLSWESTTVMDIGLDLGFLNNRLTAELDYYNKMTTDMIRSSQISIHLLRAYSAPEINIGEMRNRGVEANVTWRDKKGDFNYMVNANVAYNRNTLLKWNEFLDKGYVYVDMPYHFMYYYRDSGISQNIQDVYNAVPQSNTQAGDLMFLDVNGDGRFDANDLVADAKYNNDRPTTTFALRGSASWNGFDLAFMLQGAAGRKNYYGNGNSFINLKPASGQQNFMPEHWTYPWGYGGTNEWPRVGGAMTQSNTEFWLDNMAYLRLKNIQLGYSLPAKWTNVVWIKNLRVYATAENLATITKWRGTDPEKEGNINNVYPLIKSFSIGLNVEF